MIPVDKQPLLVGHVAMVNLNSQSLLRNAEERQKDGVAIRMSPSGTVVLVMATEWYDLDGILIRPPRNATGRGHAR